MRAGMEGMLPDVVGPGQLADALKSRHDIRLLDVRSPAEYQSLHIRGAHNIPLSELGRHCAVLSASVSAPVVLVCQSGARACQAEAVLREAGMTNVHVLEGGTMAWRAAGLPVERGRRRVSLENQVRIVVGSMVVLGSVLGVVVHPLYVLLSIAMGVGLVYTGVTNSCIMAMALAVLPYNRGRRVDVEAVIRTLASGVSPASA